jgi:hypothetical protein
LSLRVGTTIESQKLILDLPHMIVTLGGQSTLLPYLVKRRRRLLILAVGPENEQISRAMLMLCLQGVDMPEVLACPLALQSRIEPNVRTGK